jgi:nucleoside transporter
LTLRVWLQLGLMMFLQFFIWGAWYVSITSWLNASGLSTETAAVYSLCPIAAILSPLFIGILADRYLPARTVFATLHLLGAAFIWLVPSSTKTTPSLLIPLLLGHALCYMPTLGLINALTFPLLNTPERTFPFIRVGGTIGWIAGSAAVTFLPGGEQSAGQFHVAAIAGVALALFSLALPAVPTLARSKPTLPQLFGADALHLFKNRNFLIFMLCSFLLCIVLSGYYQQARNFIDFAQVKQPTLVMSLGQVSEIFFMFLLPVLLPKLGIKKILVVAMLAWALRYGFFGLAAQAEINIDLLYVFILAGILLHGICYDFFFVAGQIYVEKTAPAALRSQAQCLFVLVTWGFGMLFGAHAFGLLVSASPNWHITWLCAAALAVAIAGFFWLLFREKSDE